ncbi:MAG: hypothetical protein HOW73_11220 [Polyangiaceae bacterium]|nr:hypothetical protein [Polyangiaceae bacterium]
MGVGLRPSADAWLWSGNGAIRGITIGPIESVRHPDRGYGSRAYERALDEAKSAGATWVSLTPFGRVSDLTPEGISMSFEAPFEENRKNVLRAIEQAHERGLRVMLVPHLWVESLEWRALIDPGTDDGWVAWAAAYRDFLLAWADVAREGNVELLSIGVELRSWVTTPRVELMKPIIADVRARYHGLLTYSANWDDAEATLVWDAVDLIGINGFYPLADKDGAKLDELVKGGDRVADGLTRLASEVRKPIVLTEIGYTTRPDPAIRPWEWPEALEGVKVDEAAQADAYKALIGPLLGSKAVAGFFVWRYYADPDDVSQEAAWGFSPRGKLAEVVLRDAFNAHFEVEGSYLTGGFAGKHRARTPWRYGWESSPPLFE